MSNSNNNMQTDMPSDSPIIIMTRTFDAPRDLVWTAFTEPKHVMKWFGGHGYENPVCEMDVRPGGIWKHVMRTPDGVDHPAEYVFLEVVKPEKLVWQNADFGKRKPGELPDNTMTVTLEEAGPKLTKWTLVTRFQSVEDRDAVIKYGFNKTLSEGVTKMSDLLKTL